MGSPTEVQIEQIKHSLDGSSGNGDWYRNYYAAEHDDPDMCALVGMGMMMRGRSIPGGLQYFHVTDAGKQAVRDHMGESCNPKVRP
jgi:hypothetical protein